VSTLDEIVDRAIDFAHRALQALPSYRPATIAGLKQLRETLAQHAPDDPALGRLDAYLSRLEGRE
jgi:hypothetical protein